MDRELSAFKRSCNRLTPSFVYNIGCEWGNPHDCRAADQGYRTHSDKRGAGRQPPEINPGQVAYKQLELLISLGLTHSKAAFPSPEVGKDADIRKGWT